MRSKDAIKPVVDGVELLDRYELLCERDVRQVVPVETQTVRLRRGQRGTQSNGSIGNRRRWQNGYVEREYLCQCDASLQLFSFSPAAFSRLPRRRQ